MSEELAAAGNPGPLPPLRMISPHSCAWTSLPASASSSL